MQKFMLVSTRHLARSSNTTTLDSTLLDDFSPLCSNLMRSIVVQLIYDHLESLGFDTLGNRKLDSEGSKVGSTIKSLVLHAIAAFKPELKWLHENRFVIHVDSSSNEIMDAYFPIINVICTGDLDHLKPAVDFMYTPAFTDAMRHGPPGRVPENYVNLLKILKVDLHTRDYRMSATAYLNQRRTSFIPMYFQCDLHITLAQATTYLATQSGDLNQLQDTARITHQSRTNTSGSGQSVLNDRDRNMAALAAIF
ncbi:hypothetical protein BJ085DRAFT_37025 [Dimargaris cristalligena]|uniref:Uncharacterized protein n=1 Tax=Dimargaris cristalligena TaxID=215637 RepID=A0A4P9ZMA9_9FUNG|nr:hypothetical protein BJ085DRAFT_37025 [Dimargaris cristalligena]|eukprot:RKP33390.1 hypothetical protein BJ085DRAFT_37025 [Dimargaris cristalligena]